MVPWTIVPITGDGACLFWFLFCLVYDAQRMAREVRELIVRHVVDNWEEFSIMSHSSNGEIIPVPWQSKFWLCHSSATCMWPLA